MTNQAMDKSETTSLLRFASDSTIPKPSTKVTWKPTCKFRIIKTKGAILVLVWNFFIMITYHFLSYINGRILGANINVKTTIDRNKYYIGLLLVGLTVFYPLAGWLADVYFGRYKTIRCSVWIMWIGILLTAAMVIITQLDKSTANVISKVITLSYLVIAIGLSGYQANIIQFGVDQLVYASSEEIKAFLIWYIWTLVISGLCYDLFMQCIPENLSILKILHVAMSLTCAIVVDFLFNNYFTKEPVTSNPVKLVIQVLKYALKTKQPHFERRSASTYWEDKPPSRIDFGKSKYGGPFTNEQVEDVKTLLRMCFILSLCSIFAGATLMSIFAHFRMMNHLKDTNSNSNSFQNCLNRKTVANLHYTSWVIVIPLYEFIVRPLFQKCIPHNVQILKKFLFGMTMLLITVTIQMTIEIVGHTITTFNSNTTVTVPCLLQGRERIEHPLDISYEWLVIPQLTLATTQYILIMAAIEFICAQSPYSMKGMMFGFAYFSIGVSTIVLTGIFYPFTQKDIHWTWLGCGLWYYLLVMVIIAVTIILWVFIIKWYKKRDRDNELPNTQTFAVNYYEKYAGRTR